MQVRQPAFGDEVARARERIFGLGRKSRDDVGAEHDVGPQAPHPRGECDRVSARMAPLHALEDEIVAVLEREMQMRHEPRLVGERIEQVLIGLDRIDRRDAQAFELRNVLQDLPHQRPEPRAARQVRPIARDVDTGQHHLAVAVLGELAYLRDHVAHRDRARVPAAIGNDAKGAAVIAAVLNLDECPRVPFDAVDQVQGGLPHRHDVVDADLLFRVDTERRAIERRTLTGPECGIELAIIADDERDFTHAGEGLRLGLRRAARDDDLRIGALALEAADRLARLAHGLRRHRAGVHHHGVCDAGAGGCVADHFRLVGVEPASEGDDVDAHATAVNNDGSKRPSNSNATGPVIST